MADMIEIDKIPEIINPVIETRKKGDGTIIVEKTNENPVTITNIYNIDKIQKEINKIDSVIAIWESKKAPLQAIIDEYEGWE